jgi:hypothetical protein
MAVRYTDNEKKLLDWVSSKISTPEEMGEIAPTIALILNREESAIRKQIEDRKLAQGYKEFFWANT